MYRDGKQVITSDKHNFVINHAAMGDMICSLPAIAMVGKRYSATMDLRVWVPTWQMDLVRHLLAPYGKFDVRDFFDFPSKWEERRRDPDFGPVSLNAPAITQYTRNRVHMVDFAFNFLTDGRPESMQERSYLTDAPLGPFPPLVTERHANYVVFPVGATSENKLFRASVMGPIMVWCLENGYTPVITGTKTNHTKVERGGIFEPIVLREQSQMLPKEIFEQCIDLREKTTLLELRDVLGHAQAVVGVDGGTIHLAATTDVPIVYAMGATLPKHRYIPRHGDHNFRIRYVVPRDLECAGCQSNWRFSLWDFSNCAYGDSKCMEMLHPDDFINGLKEMGL